MTDGCRWGLSTWWKHETRETVWNMRWRMPMSRWLGTPALILVTIWSWCCVLSQKSWKEKRYHDSHIVSIVLKWLAVQAEWRQAGDMSDDKPGTSQMPWWLAICQEVKWIHVQICVAQGLMNLLEWWEACDDNRCSDAGWTWWYNQRCSAESSRMICELDGMMHYTVILSWLTYRLTCMSLPTACNYDEHPDF